MLGVKGRGWGGQVRYRRSKETLRRMIKKHRQPIKYGSGLH